VKAQTFAALTHPGPVLVTLSEPDERFLASHFERGRVTPPRLFTSRRAVDYPWSTITIVGRARKIVRRMSISHCAVRTA
jgi:hypothetical protein